MKRKIKLLIILSASLASACVTTGRKPEPDEQSIKDAAGYNLQLGVTYMRQGKMEVSLEKLQRSREQDPDRADTHAALAVLYTRLGETDKAAGTKARRRHAHGKV